MTVRRTEELLRVNTHIVTYGSLSRANICGATKHVTGKRLTSNALLFVALQRHSRKKAHCVCSASVSEALLCGNTRIVTKCSLSRAPICGATKHVNGKRLTSNALLFVALQRHSRTKAYSVCSASVSKALLCGNTRILTKCSLSRASICGATKHAS